MLSAQAMETLSGLQKDYKNQLSASLNAPANLSIASMRFEENRFYMEQVLQEFSEEEIKQNYVHEMVQHLRIKKIIKGDGIEMGRATDAIKILQHYLLTRSDV